MIKRNASVLVDLQSSTSLGPQPSCAWPQLLAPLLPAIIKYINLVRFWGLWRYVLVEAQDTRIPSRTLINILRRN